MHEAFTFDTRLGIYLLREDVDFSQYSPEERQQIRGQWLMICSTLTDRIADLEVEIMDKLERMYEVETEDEMHDLNTEMMDKASAVCDLNILVRSVYEGLNKVHF